LVRTCPVLKTHTYLSMIFIVDFGSQLAHLIGRRLKGLGAPFRIIDPDTINEEIKTNRPAGIIFSGGPSSVYEPGTPTIDPSIFSLSIPVLGICYGWQLMAKLLGGDVKNTTKEYGPQQLTMKNPGSIFHLPKNEIRVFMSHGDTVVRMPDGFTVSGVTPTVEYAAVSDWSRKLFGVQFHPEADHTEFGTEILANFLIVCGETLSPVPLNPDATIATIKETVGTASVLCGVSGGVDSTVAAALIGKAIGKRLVAVYIESGLMRPGTKENVQKLFGETIPTTLVVVEARDTFLSRLKGITDPEEKRKTIGKLYIELFEQEAKKHENITFLAQGTIYSDVIESKGTKRASHIKSHHNVGGLPAIMNLTLLEPLRTLYKDEVKDVGRLLGIPEIIVNTQPYPGPGYAVRIRGEVTEPRLASCIQADTIIMDEMGKAGLLSRVFQCFAVMTGAFSTAVKGDGRVFAEVVAIRAYESKDIMTSMWADIPYDVLARMSSRIVNEVPNISRVVYDITTKPPATMEWE
jgi:GMP synthase (glutamine-hydrolysing)